MSQIIVEASGLIKSFGDFRAVNGVDFSISQGECFGLLGPNGAGKSTIINMLYGAARRTGGGLKVFGLDPEKDGRQVKKRLGVVTQDNALDESLTVYENMQIYAAFVGVPKAQREGKVSELLDFMNLKHRASSPIRSLSGGMKRRLVFVRALLAEPDLVILDEPTTGLDPAVRHSIWGKVQELKAKGTTLILTTHYMHEAEILCDRVAILNQGKILAVAPPQELIARHVPGFVGIYHPQGIQLARFSEGQTGLEVAEDRSGVYVRAPNLDDLTAISRRLKVEPAMLRPANLEDVFLKLTGKELSLND